MLRISSLRVLSRRVLPTMQLKILNLYKSLLLLLFHLFIAPSTVSYPVCLFFCDLDVQLLHQLFGDCPGGLPGV